MKLRQCRTMLLFSRNRSSANGYDQNPYRSERKEENGIREGQNPELPESRNRFCAEKNQHRFQKTTRDIEVQPAIPLHRQFPSPVIMRIEVHRYFLEIRMYRW